ncbi:hypothetical protein [Compostibacter hankyongensis]|uniref:Uncharacterized protein n=1 Tax=Compostibacter hankyongensis TaxID=1007089 RepID=A0ABP8FXK6_9BACT
MEHPINTAEDNALNDVATSWVSTSRFIFYLVVAALVAYSVAMCFGLYAHRYKGKPDVTVPSNTLYNPKYK